MAKTYEFKVTGRGRFPFDMLRYDACYPHRPLDVEGLTSDAGKRPSESRREVNLLSHVKPPTIGRWESFGWVVSDVKVVKG